MLDQDSQKTYLGASYSTGAGTIGVKNINAFTPSWAIQLGKTGEETSEIVLLGTATPSGTNLILSGTLKYDHSTDTPVYAIKYNQLIFEVSTTGTSGAATPISAGTVNITSDSQYTQFDHTAGLTTYAYKVKYYNSALDESTTESDWIVPTGYSSYSLSKMRERVKRRLLSANYIQKDEVIDDWINEWLEKMTNAAIDVNRDYLIGTTSITFSANQQYGTVTATDYKEIRKISMVTSSGTATMNRMNINDFRDDQVFTESFPHYYWIGDTVLGRKPIDNAGTAIVYYYKRPTILSNDADEIPVSMQNYTKSFVDYAYAQACFLDQKDEKGYAFINMANAELAQFKQEIAPRWKSGIQHVTVVTPLSSEDDFQLV